MNLYIYISPFMSNNCVYPFPLFIFTVTNFNYSKHFLPSHYKLHKITRNKIKLINKLKFEMEFIKEGEGEIYGIDLCCKKIIDKWKKRYKDAIVITDFSSEEARLGNLLYHYFRIFYLEIYNKEYPQFELLKNNGKLTPILNKRITEQKILPSFFRRTYLLTKLDSIPTWATKDEKRFIPYLKRKFTALSRERYK